MNPLHTLCVRLICHNQGLQSENSFLIYHKVFVLYKTRHKNLNPNSDYFCYCQLQYFYVFAGIVNPYITILTIFISTCLYKKHFILYLCDISDLYDLVHSLVGSKNI